MEGKKTIQHNNGIYVFLPRDANVEAFPIVVFKLVGIDSIDIDSRSASGAASDYSQTRPSTRESLNPRAAKRFNFSESSVLLRIPFTSRFC